MLFRNNSIFNTGRQKPLYMYFKSVLLILNHLFNTGESLDIQVVSSRREVTVSVNGVKVFVS